MIVELVEVLKKVKINIERIRKMKRYLIQIEFQGIFHKKGILISEKRTSHLNR